MNFEVQCSRLHYGHTKTTGEYDEKAEHDEIEEENQIVLQTIDARQRQGIVDERLRQRRPLT